MFLKKSLEIYQKSGQGLDHNRSLFKEGHFQWGTLYLYLTLNHFKVIWNYLEPLLLSDSHNDKTTTIGELFKYIEHAADEISSDF